MPAFRGLSRSSPRLAARGVAFGPLFEHGHDPGLSLAETLAHEVRRDRRLSRSRGAGHEHAVTLENAATHHRIQLGDPRGQPAPRAVWFLPSDHSQRARERLHAITVDTDGVAPWHRLLTAQLHDLELPHHGIAFRVLRQPEQSVGHREHRIIAKLAVRVLPDQERRRLPGGEENREPVDERLELDVTGIARRLARQCAKRVHDHHARVRGLHRAPDRIEHASEILLHDRFAQIDEADRLVHLRRIEERVLLLVPQHLQSRFSEHGEVQRGSCCRGIREQDLVHQRGLAAAGCARDDVERELGQSAAQDFIEPAHASRQLANLHLGG